MQSDFAQHIKVFAVPTASILPFMIISVFCCWKIRFIGNEIWQLIRLKFPERLCTHEISTLKPYLSASCFSLSSTLSIKAEGCARLALQTSVYLCIVCVMFDMLSVKQRKITLFSQTTTRQSKYCHQYRYSVMECSRSRSKH